VATVFQGRASVLLFQWTAILLASHRRVTCLLASSSARLANRDFCKVEKWTKDGAKVDHMLYAGGKLVTGWNNLSGGLTRWKDVPRGTRMR
jgi:hypothetical protein